MSLTLPRGVLLCVLPGLLCAGQPDVSSWTNVQALAPGVYVQVTRKTGPVVRGVVENVAADSIGLRAGQQALLIPRVEVARVAAKSRRHAKLIGLAIGAGAGAGAGAALGARLANESAGDLDFKALSTVVVMGAGALIGLAIGSALDLRHSTVYQAK